MPTRLDRYPAKMVSKLADRLIERYAHDATSVLDPFSGSGAILMAARRRGIPVTGIDINPVAELFFRVKVHGFDARLALSMARGWIHGAERAKRTEPIRWDAKSYWFTPTTLDKFERLKSAVMARDLKESQEGAALLLCFSLAVRLCSRADQRSPKPFISKQARHDRRGRHFDPYCTIISLLEELSSLYGRRTESQSCTFLLADLPVAMEQVSRLGKFSHIITSPPYINAQDYYRNFKLELYFLEDLLPFKVSDLRERFIGTERGDLLEDLSSLRLNVNCGIVPELASIKQKSARLSAVVHRYLSDMRYAFATLKTCLDSDGCVVLVCGDNLIGGIRIRTWRVLQSLLEQDGFQLFDQFTDQIGDRLLAPKRNGHKGLIKEEVVSAFRAPKCKTEPAQLG